jgi:formylmethanofuran dehydrogenase subunit E
MNLPIHEAVAAAWRASGMNHVAVHKAVQCETCGLIVPLTYFVSLNKWLCRWCASRMNVWEVIKA